MKLALHICSGALIALSLAATADAAGGCGRGFHRGPAGVCRPNLGPGAVVVAPPRAGIYYRGRGWWDGRRYWAHRDHWHGGWRYR